METLATSTKPLSLELLRRYFYSGWAFLMPYLFAYLLYYATGWSVNPAIPVAGNGLGAMGNGAIEATHNLSPIASHLGSIPVPCLLHIYWALHAIHAILAGFALWGWWASYRSKHQGPNIKCRGPEPSPSGSDLPTTNYLLPTTSPSFSLLTALAPWLLLALLFYIPGVYLEWPSDPWEHLRRINEWRILDTVGAHSSWLKSSYFIPYSFLSWCIGLRQLFWLDFYYTGICLLLCWQYYRFSRACGLGERASMVFVIIQALLFGNNIFSFYRYYGISSSIYAQLGAVALTRIFLEWAARGTTLGTNLGHRGHGALTQSETGGMGVGPLACAPLSDPGKDARSDATRPSPIAHHPSPIPDMPLAPGADPAPPPRFWHLPSLLRLSPIALCLLPLIAFNHVQGLGIAGLGIAAVCVWRLIEWKRSALWWLIGGTIVANALFLWLYPRPVIIETYRAQGWLNSWLGFNVLDLTSPAGDRMLQIVSTFGLVNLAAALFALRRNQATAWLTITPVFTLILPCISIPLAYALSRHGDISNIVTFQRLLFTVPFGLCSVELGGQILSNSFDRGGSPRRKRYKTSLIESTCFSFTALAVVVNANMSYSRFWHANAITPTDLKLFDIVGICELPKADRGVKTLKVITTQAGAVLPFFTSRIATTGHNRTIGQPAVAAIAEAMDTLGVDNCIAAREPFPPETKDPYTSTPSNLISDSNAHIPASWINLGGYAPLFINDMTELETPSTWLENPTGLTSLPFTARLIPIQRIKSYRIQMNIRQTKKTDATVYLAVAWYDFEGKLLVADQPKDNGAGNPHGWTNGTYSYFGLLSQVPPLTWTTYGISFGLNEAADIPRHARFLRVGALLNNNGTPLARVQLTNIQFHEIPTPAFSSALAVATSVYSRASVAGILSGHWPPQQVDIDRGGSSEIARIVEQASAERLSKKPTTVP